MKTSRGTGASLAALPALKTEEASTLPSTSSAARRDFLVFGLTYVAAATAFALVAPAGHALQPVPAALAVLLYVGAAKVPLPLRVGWANAIELPFVVLVFTAPLTAVPLVVGCCQLAIPIVRRTRLSRLRISLGDSWYAIAPVLVIALFAPGPARWQHWFVYLAAFAAQLAVSTAFDAARCALLGQRLGLIDAFTPCVVDAALIPVGLMAAVTARDAPAATGAVLLGTFGLFALLSGERRARLAQTKRALHDPLTGLPNRALFNELVSACEKRCRRDNIQAAVLLLDMDDFKGINDRFGHQAGDAALCEFGIRVRGCVRAADTVARLGGDEFAVLLAEPCDLDAASAVAAKVRRTFAEPLSLDTGETLPHMRASIGAAVFGCGITGAEALERADVSLYEDKRSASATPGNVRIAG